MIRNLLVLIFCVVTSGLVTAQPVSIKTPKPLIAQVQRLTELLRDSYAVGYPEATIFQMVKSRQGEELALVVFTVEGFGGGNNHTQYFAAFTPESNETGQPHFTLIDVIPIGGKSWRGIMNLNAKVSRNLKTAETLISFDGLEVAGDDAPNFPSKKVKINLMLKGGRLVEK